MELLHPHCAGLDLHKETVVACIRHMVDSKVTTEVKTFKTTTQELMERVFSARLRSMSLRERSCCRGVIMWGRNQ